jgi:hypothetical protein
MVVRFPLMSAVEYELILVIPTARAVELLLAAADPPPPPPPHAASTTTAIKLNPVLIRIPESLLLLR